MRFCMPCIAALLLLACDDKSAGEADTSSADAGPSYDSAAPYVDADGDGWSADDGDCDESNPDIAPGQIEQCNGIDDNCNGVADEGFSDVDTDGTADCVDVEDCDGIDNNGDGVVDEGFTDADGDGSADCIDEEVCDGVDNNGDGAIDEGFDADGDGYTSCGTDEIAGDCDDDDYTINPGEADVDGDLIDNDCDGAIDEGLWRAGDLVITELMINPSSISDTDGEWIELYNTSGEERVLNGLVLTDESGSDYYQLTSESIIALGAGEYIVLGRNADIDESGGIEIDVVYDGVSLSNESDALVVMFGELVLDVVRWDDGETMPDEAGTSVSLDPGYFDADENDSASVWCSTAWPTVAEADVLSTPGEDNALCPTLDHDDDGYSIAEGDCDDTSDEIGPHRAETPYDGIDNDCDATTLDDDLDEDGFLLVDDCDDEEAEAFPGNIEVCDGIDNDCDNLADDDDPDITGTRQWYPDDDGDGYGDADAAPTETCDELTGYIEDNTDCDDSSADYNPGIIEDDCDDPSDYNCDGQVAFIDEDYDGYSACDEDCDDSDARIFPYAWEDTSDGVDNDCDGYTDTDDPDSPSFLSLGDDASSRISLTAGFPYCGSTETSANVISNGRILFGSSDTSYSESSASHASSLAIAGVWDDLNPSSGGKIAVLTHSDATAVHFLDVREYGTSSTVTFSIIMLDDGRITLSYGDVGVSDGLAGWSCGTASSATESDLTDEVTEVPPNSLGIGQGTEDSIHELFTGVGDSNDLSGATFTFCVGSGTDADGDGWTDACGDTNDADASVTP